MPFLERNLVQLGEASRLWGGAGWDGWMWGGF